MSPAHARSGRGDRGGRGERRSQLLTALTAVLSVLVLAASGAAWAAISYGDSQLTRLDIFGDITGARPEKVADAMNVLIVGSDIREGLSREDLKRLHVGSTKTAEGQRADVVLLVHVPKKRDGALVVSFPRDSLVTIPAHKNAAGAEVDAKDGKLNAAYRYGGPGLTVQTIETATGVRIDHYVEVNFAGFVRVVDAIGTVPVCSNRPLKDDKAGLDLPAGTTKLDGVRALQYVRAREVDPTKDIGRIKRQQAFLASLAHESLRSGVLLRPDKLTRLVNAVLDAVQADKGLSRDDVLDLAKRLGGADSAQVKFVTVPLADSNARHPVLGSVVTWDQAAASALFDRVRTDRPLPSAPAISPAPGQVSVPPSNVRVRVLNATATQGLAARTADQLRVLGFVVAGEPANAPGADATQSVIRYDPRYSESVKTLAAAIPDARLEQVAGLGRTLEVRLGASFRSVHKPRVSAPTPTASTAAPRTAADDICT